LLIYSNNL